MKLDLHIRTRNVDYDRYVDVYFSEEFNRSILAVAGLRDRVLEEQTTLPDGRERRRVRMVPEVALPGPIKKLAAGAEISYHEITVYDPNARSARFDVETPAGDLIRVGGEVRIAVDGSGIHLHFVGDVKVKIFGIGKLIERFIVSDVKKRYDKVEAALQRYLDAQN